MFLTQGLKFQIKDQFQVLFSNKRFWLHGLFIAYMFYASMFIMHRAHNDEQLLLQILLGIVSLITVYAFLLIVIPIAKWKQRIWVIWIGLFSVMFISIHLTYYLVNLFRKDDLNYGLFVRVIINGVWAFLALYYFFDLYIQQRQLNIYKEKLQQQIIAENRFLKQQINPHFLFNTLNNTYAQSMQHPLEAVESLKQLKIMLHYMLYECEQDFVSLKDELNFVESYTTLEKIRNKSTDLDVRFDVHGIIEHQNIAPLLLINFIENAFKHGVKSNIDNAFVHVDINVNGQELSLKVLNSKPQKNESTTSILTEGGIGIENVKRRLILLYPDRFQLELDDQPHSFLVKLNLQLY